MNKQRLKKFVEIIDRLTEEELYVDFKVLSSLDPATSPEGGHGGLISLAANHIPILAKIYKRLCKSWQHPHSVYNFAIWETALEVYLKVIIPLPDWAAENPALWGNEFGEYMYSSPQAFSDETGNFLYTTNYQFLAAWWRDVCNRVHGEESLTKPIVDKQRLKAFVKALQALPLAVKEMGVNMTSDLNPACETVGCHAGMISMLAYDFPPLKRIYSQLVKTRGLKGYNYLAWQKALEVYLKLPVPLPSWAGANPTLWGTAFGEFMFKTDKAFEDSEGNPPYEIDHAYLIEHWQEVCDRVCA